MEKIKYEKGGREGWHKFVAHLNKNAAKRTKDRIEMDADLQNYGSGGGYMLHNTGWEYTVIYFEHEEDRTTMSVMLTLRYK